MSAESTRHLTNRRTRFRSSTNNEQGTVTEELDVAHHVYPIKPPADTNPATGRPKGLQIRPAGFVGLGLTMLFLGLHQCIYTIQPLRDQPRQQQQPQRRGSQLLLLLTLCGAAAQLIAGVRDRIRGGTLFGLVLHSAHSVVWMTTALLLLLLRRRRASSPDKPADGSGSGSGNGSAVAASMLLMAAALSCAAGAVWARATRSPVLRLLAGVGAALLCLSRAAFQRPHDAATAVAMDRYAGVFLLLSSFLSFGVAWRGVGHHHVHEVTLARQNPS
ncbi:hypothetical protein MY4824_006038 [Beauveria thailandica]